jgi:septal ring factor EnvC (AmiA/AmiB activator)
MNLKKVIIAFSILLFLSLIAINTHFTLQNKIKIQSAVTVSELPPPPGVPGAHFEQPTQINTGFSTEISAEIFQQKITEINTLTQKINTLENNQNQIRQELNTLKQEINILDSNIKSLQQNIHPVTTQKTNVLGIILDIILLLAVTGIIGFLIYKKKEEENERINAIEKYLEPYIKQGYAFEQITPYLKAAGYTIKEIEQAKEKINKNQINYGQNLKIKK